MIPFRTGDASGNYRVNRRRASRYASSSSRPLIKRIEFIATAETKRAEGIVTEPIESRARRRRTCW